MSCIFRKIAVSCFLMSAIFFSFGATRSSAGNKEADLQVILNEMKNQDASIRENAIQKLVFLIDLEYDAEKNVNVWVGLEEKRGTVVSSLMQLLKDEDKLVRQKAAITLGWIDPIEREESIPILTEAIKENSKYAGEAILSLLKYGPKARSAVPVIIEAMKKKPDETLWEDKCVSVLERIGTPKALEAIKPYRQKQANRRKLVRPIAIISGSRIGSSLMILGFLGLFWWSRIQRKKGLRLIGWPLFIPMLFWGVCVYEPVNYLPLFDFQIQISLLVITLVGIVPWLLSLLWQLRKKRATPVSTP